MRIFVSARMTELQTERKACVEAIYYAGHDPVYVETELISETRQPKSSMDLMIQRSEAMICMCYMSLGPAQRELGHRTPIEYELAAFRDVRPKGNMAIFIKETDWVRRDSYLDDWLDKQRKRGTQIILFSDAARLSQQIFTCVKKWAREPTKGPVAAKGIKKVVRVEGPDYVGLVEIISETLFSDYGVNVEYISQGARAGFATLLLEGTFPEQGLVTNETLRKRLAKAIKEDMKNESHAQSYLSSRMKKFGVSVKVLDSPSGNALPEFLTEIRTINTPGQLNAVCKVLKKSKFNIDDITLKPAPAQYPRQTIITLWLSQANPTPTEHEDSVLSLLRLEAEIRNIVGVLAFSIKKLIYEK